MAEDATYTVLRFSLYHCELNPIELVRAQVKQDVASRNNTFKTGDTEWPLKEAVDYVTTDRWHGCVEHVKTLQGKFRQSDIDESYVEPDVMALDANDPEKEPEDDEAGDDNENIDWCLAIRVESTDFKATASSILLYTDLHDHRRQAIRVMFY